jgi:hypothetical protein
MTRCPSRSIVRLEPFYDPRLSMTATFFTIPNLFEVPSHSMVPSAWTFLQPRAFRGRLSVVPQSVDVSMTAGLSMAASPTVSAGLSMFAVFSMATSLSIIPKISMIPSISRSSGLSMTSSFSMVPSLSIAAGLSMGSSLSVAASLSMIAGLSSPPFYNRGLSDPGSFSGRGPVTGMAGHAWKGPQFNRRVRSGEPGCQALHHDPQ